MQRLTRRSLLAATAAAPFALQRAAGAQDSSPIQPLDPSVTPTDSGSVTLTGRYFGDTGHNLKAPFLDMWTKSGGRDGIGAPLSEERYQEDTGVVQSFRAVTLVFDPALAEPWTIQATHIPAEVRRLLAPGSARKSVSRATGSDSEFYAETGHTLSGKFREFWRSH